MQDLGDLVCHDVGLLSFAYPNGFNFGGDTFELLIIGFGKRKDIRSA